MFKFIFIINFLGKRKKKKENKTSYKYKCLIQEALSLAIQIILHE
jgi:hypothetical protein